MDRNWLEELSQISNVQAVYVLNSEGEVLQSFGTRFSKNVLNSLIKHLFRIATVFQGRSHSLNMIEFYWDSVYIVCRFDRGTMVLIACNLPVSSALLRMTLNVAANQLSKDNKIKGAALKADKWLKDDLSDSEKNMLSKLK